MPYKIILIDDHKLFRVALQGILSQEKDFVIIKEYSEASEVLQNIHKDEADLYLVDINLNDDDGLILAQKIKIKRSDVKVIILSSHKEEYYLSKAIDNDADGYIHKDSEPEELIFGMKKVLKGDRHFSSEISKILINSAYSSPKDSNKLTDLSLREKEIIKYIVDGHSSKKVSELLSLSPRTVETHRGRILTKLGLKNTAELVRLAIEQKLF